MARGGKRKGAGRPKGAVTKATVEIRALASEHSRTAMDVLVGIATGGQSESARVAAAKEILDRAYGRPPQAIIGGGPDDPPVQIQQIELRAVYPNRDAAAR